MRSGVKATPPSSHFTGSGFVNPLPIDAVIT